jgi:hypothetical protein
LSAASAKEKKLRDRWQQQSRAQRNARQQQRRSLRIGLACFSLYPVFAKGFEIPKHTRIAQIQVLILIHKLADLDSGPFTVASTAPLSFDQP